MWDDVIIGRGNKGCTAIKVFAIPGDHSISQNDVSFWIACCMLDIGMTIFKDTIEGTELTRLIEAGTSLEKIQEWLDCVALNNIEVKNLRQRIEWAKEKSFEEGKKAKAMEIRSVLGIGGSYYVSGH